MNFNSTGATMEKETKVKKLKECPICCFDVQGFSQSPKSCRDSTGGQITHQESEKCCNECWEAHISYSIETKHVSEISCIFCSSALSADDIGRLCRKDTSKRYETKLRDSLGIRCIFRCAGTDTPVQPHDPELDGSIFQCRLCQAQYCLDCDRPHTDEKCDKFWKRIAPHHDKAEKEMAGAGFKQCPSCLSWGDLSGHPLESCGYMQCSACAYRWCGHCNVAWCGPDSYYTKGGRAHAEGCRYHRALPSTYARKRLFGEEKDAWDKKGRRAKMRKEARAEKKRVNVETGSKRKEVVMRDFEETTAEDVKEPTIKVEEE